MRYHHGDSGNKHTELDQYIAHNPCDPNKCISYARNHRNRGEISKNGNILSQLYSNPHCITDTLNEQILDRIHCYYMHPIGHAMQSPLNNQQKRLKGACHLIIDASG